MSEQILIEKSVPIPLRAGSHASKYPFKGMEIGDSFFVACSFEESGKVRSSMSIFSKRNKNLKFTSSFQKSPEGIRVWRIK
jgi:hypothetical protein